MDYILHFVNHNGSTIGRSPVVYVYKRFLMFQSLTIILHRPTIMWESPQWTLDMWHTCPHWHCRLDVCEWNLGTAQLYENVIAWSTWGMVHGSANPAPLLTSCGRKGRISKNKGYVSLYHSADCWQRKVLPFTAQSLLGICSLPLQLVTCSRLVPSMYSYRASELNTFVSKKDALLWANYNPMLNSFGLDVKTAINRLAHYMLVVFLQCQIWATRIEEWHWLLMNQLACHQNHGFPQWYLRVSNR